MKTIQLVIFSTLSIFLLACTSQPGSTGSASVAGNNTASGATREAAQPQYSVDSNIGDILDDPKAKEVLVSYWPAANSPQMSMARGMSLRTIAPFARGLLNDEKLQEIDEGLRTMTVNPNPEPWPPRPKE